MAIHRKDGDRVRLWARTTSDYSNTFTRICDAEHCALDRQGRDDGEAIVLRPDVTSDFEPLKLGQGQAEAILVPGQDVRPEPLEERRNRL